jgi:hypothetical protein
MQEAVRYYITKRGDEPTVRSVKVALGAESDDQMRDESGSAGEFGDTPGESRMPRDRAAIGGLVKMAARKRSHRR